MRLFATTIDISASADRVWSVMSDIERWHEWTASITSVERLTSGALGIGSKARVRQPKLPPAMFGPPASSGAARRDRTATRWAASRGLAGLNAVSQSWRAVTVMPDASPRLVSLETACYVGEFKADRK